VNCNEAQAVIDGYVDRELDLVSSLEMERHLETCDACTQVYQNRQALQASIRGGALYHPLPPDLQKRVLASVRQAERADLTQRPETPSPAKPVFRLRLRSLAAAAAFLCVGFLGWGIGHVSSLPSGDDPVAQEVFAGDVRALMATNQGIEVRSSDQHTVKPWFAGKLDFSPPVQDFAAQGFPLVGGRRDYLNGRTVAVLVYKRHEHWINLFIWPSPRTEGIQRETRQGYHLIHWSKEGMTYWAVSDVNLRELQDFVRLVQSEA
jgi:anti-sigma factor RsiW